jgi:hypothetical protein
MQRQCQAVIYNTVIYSLLKQNQLLVFAKIFGSNNVFSQIPPYPSKTKFHNNQNKSAWKHIKISIKFFNDVYNHYFIYKKKNKFNICQTT